MTTIIKPYFIITAGATGSGKTKLITEVMKYLNIETKPFIKLLVDDLVENDDKYKCKVTKIINSVLDECKKEVNCTIDDYTDCEQNKYNNPSEKLFKKFSDAYFTTRKEENCKPLEGMTNIDNLSCQSYYSIN